MLLSVVFWELLYFRLVKVAFETHYLLDQNYSNKV
jgi:hypothetical protein